ncbi:D-methionine transport system substrate-binding protein [Herbaspirillum sp. Sphag1AN]|uniref:MetQ/NlpA family ABC transporter substrate-binding protein n=1 Tax=unclassified Herbaspirillum TaxID=2624150 RepID=UPI00161FD52E|nr:MULTISPECIES: MetQ/NlpA family ABC transporter substrate-binding protein [unclassified Herbaspirillum]MBB3211631.1 D-methionine transport system substrate-binding protein [Herbaspirillum sp. Sphag1AN]MBB3245101.1 D-methionine transport system substrate-binding protein [Herbaspirillum sp. Sphag64]
MHAKTLSRFILAASISLSFTLLHAQVLTIGTTPGVLNDSVEVAAREAKKQGLEVRVVEMTDWTTPNVALQSGDLDLNYFQHSAFLENAIRDRGYKFAKAGYGVLPNIGLFSSHIKTLSDLKDGATVAVANDPVNQGRGLLLVERAGLIKLKPGIGSKATLADIVSNPKKLQFKEIEGPQLVRALDDVDLAQGYPAHFVAAGRPDIAKSGLQYSTVDDLQYAIVFVARADKVNDPRIQKFIKIYQESPAVLAKIDALYVNDKRLYSLAWQKK